MAALTNSQALQGIKDFYLAYLPNYTTLSKSWESDVTSLFNTFASNGQSLKAAYEYTIATAISIADTFENSFPSNPVATGSDVYNPISFVNKISPNDIVNYYYPSASAATKAELITALGNGTLSVTNLGTSLSILKASTSPSATDLINATIQLTGAADLPVSGLHLSGVNDVQQDFIVSMYIGAFGRAPDYDGAQFWAGTLARDIQSGTNQSSAFLTIGQNMYAAGTVNGEGGTQMQNSEFINYAYNNALGRAADTSGFTYWLQNMDAGRVNRGDFLTTFLTAAMDSQRDSNYLVSRIAVGEFAAQKHVSYAGIDTVAVLSGVNDQASAINAINGIVQTYGNAPAAYIQLTGVASQADAPELFYV